MYLSNPVRRVVGAVAIGVLSLGLAACGSETSSPASVAVATTVVPDEAMTEDSMSEEAMSEDSMSEDSMTEDSMTEDSMSEEAMSEDAMSEVPAWQSMAITDVAGTTFTLDDFHGRPVLVETFATWCPSCRSQLATTNAVAASAGDAAVVIALSVETDISATDVQRYAEDNGFDAVRFAVVTPELLAALVDGFGQSITNPPSTPKFVIDPMGTAGELTTGSESADKLAAQLGLAG